MARPGKITLPALVAACAVGIVAGGVAVAQQEGGHRGAGPHAQAEGGASGYATRFMQLFDTDGDGKVSADEIAADQARLFRALDIDGNGTLSVEEVRRRGYILQVWRVTTMFDLMDVNGDRQLTVEEITAPMKRWFARYDANSDGAMEATEVPERRRPGRGRRTER